MALSALLLAGCAQLPPAPGTAADEVRRTWGTPTGTHALAAGGTRLEYATGPYGRTTWMIDLDAAGRVQQARQAAHRCRRATSAQAAAAADQGPGTAAAQLIGSMAQGVLH